MVQFRLDTDTKTFDAVTFDGVPTVTSSVLAQFISYLDATSDINDWRVDFGPNGAAHIWRHEWDEGEWKNLVGELVIVPDALGSYRLDLADIGLDLMQEQ